MKTRNTTLLLIIKDNKILLATKKRGFGEGKFNGVGGKVEKCETIEEAMVRETKEEIGVTPIDYKQVATINFDEYYKGEQELVIMNIFVARNFSGELVESDEMKPVWFNLNEIPYNKMFPDDSIWLPLVLDNKEFTADFKFDENFNLLSHDIQFKN